MDNQDLGLIINSALLLDQGFVFNQEPDYLDAQMPYGEEQLYTLKLRNINLLGVTGVHILPNFEPWIATFNMWSIDVEGLWKL